MEIKMTDLYPYATKMLNLGKFGYMHRITNLLNKIEQTEPLLGDQMYVIRTGAEEFINGLMDAVQYEEADAKERYYALGDD
jgi:hypothetical protein